ncbi:MFS polyamine transporter [Sistotremastrum niveocremeum HHB9708]|uniref:MFS polyamine transporter n=1 Tax=Sistotremastrum niveocremeum HHB9708 TaxID=1314777 RepID=A0A164R0B8_9AGAM|nr:MFS polyamine transporter [Sistotremastrum niveocremeum HHB9708]
MFQTSTSQSHPQSLPLSNSSTSASTAVHTPQDDEAEFERYGGDEPRDPPPKPQSGKEPSLAETHVEQPERNEKDREFLQWDGPDDPSNPQNMSRTRKWFITILCAVLTINVTFASSAPSSATMAIAQEFEVSSEVATLITTLFLCGYVFGPLIWAPGSEFVGRRPIFTITILCYCLTILGQALAPNIATLMVTRFLSGLFASAPLTNCGGVIADIWDPVTRGTAASIFSASVFIGPVIGPMIGGYLTMSHLGWRWIFWIMMIFAGLCWVLAFLFLPETFAPYLLLKKARRMRKQDPEKHKDVIAEHELMDRSLKGLLHRTVFRPFQMLALEPILILVTIYLSIVYGLLYALFESFPIIWAEKRGFNLGESGLIFIGVGIGTTIGALVNIHLGQKYKELMKTWRGFPPPENRLPGAIAAGPFLVVGIMWIGWTGAYASVPWYVPALGTIVLGISFSLIFISLITYIIETYLMYSASALAANTVIRSAVAAAFPLFTVQMFDNLGVQWASTLIGGIAILLAPTPYIFWKYGHRIRARSRFAPCPDLKIREEIEAEKLSRSSSNV